jgi:hypothetical protein
MAGVSYAEDKVPAFRFADEVSAMADATQEMIDLESRIAVANATAMVAEDMSLCKAIRA